VCEPSAQVLLARPLAGPRICAFLRILLFFDYFEFISAFMPDKSVLIDCFIYLSNIGIINGIEKYAFFWDFPSFLAIDLSALLQAKEISLRAHHIRILLTASCIFLSSSSLVLIQ
jgi:hypothetical protein